MASESLNTLRIVDGTNLTNSDVNSRQNIIDHDELAGSTNFTPYQRSRRCHKVVRLLRTLKNPFVLIASPLLFSPLLLHAKPEYNCAYCLLVMSVYWMTEALPLAITALLPTVLFPIAGVLPAKAVAREYLNDTNFLFIGGLIVAVAVEKCNLHERLALSVLQMVGSQPKWILLGFMLATAVLSMFISNTATTAMMVPIVQSVTDQLLRSYKLHGKTENSDLLAHTKPSPRETLMAKGLLIGICFAANIGGTGTITGTPPNLVVIGVLSALFSDAETGVHYLSWMAFALPMMICCLFACWAVLVVIFLRDAPPADDGVTKMMKQRYESLPRMSFAEKSVGISFLILLVMWITRQPEVVPGFGDLFGKDQITDATSAMFISLLLFALPEELPSMNSLFGPETNEKKTGSNRLMDWPTMQKKFPWSVILLLGGGFALASGVKESGLSLLIGQMLASLNGLPVWTLQLVCIGVTMLTTNVCSNTVAASIFLPIVANLAQETGVNPLALMLPTTIAASFAFILPIGTPPNAIVFASGTLKVSDMIISGFLVSAVTALITVIYMNSGALLVFSLNELPDWAALNGTIPN
ncbi:Sodium-dependent high-affinity dicarboxylate transporter 3 [Aphelenchoides besseyi]|nr:Sodium-dependent high-affinity dicarboxylate transporter 3 [Aphelenchoides besseyi]